ncbi:MAG: hypothetical protein HY555_06045 [Euryarchaeota archaeon]|nr:hypothetical protein [Euryarchaeota archaeon]
MPEEDLLEFYGTECVHCKAVEPLIERLRAEERIEIQRLEVWHNEKNAALMRQLDKGYCGGVPFFYNKRTGKWLCGSVDYETLRRWAQGK